jgi:hypothetical protein
MSKSGNGYRDEIGEFLYVIFCVETAMIGYTIHHSLFWAIVNFFLAPIAWGYWLVTHQVNMSIIRETFLFFLR